MPETTTPTTTASQTDARALADALQTLDNGGVTEIVLPDSGATVELMRAVSPAQNASTKPARAKPARAKPARAKPARAKPTRARPNNEEETWFTGLMKRAVALLEGETAKNHVRAGSDGVVTYHDPVVA